MPKKRHRNYLKSSQTLSPSAGADKAADKPQKSVNELLSQLRYTSLAAAAAAASSSSSTAGPATPSPFAANTPTVPPSLRHILQIPESPTPRPRRPVRQRFDANGRRLPAGPPPPRSWTSPSPRLPQGSQLALSKAESARRSLLSGISLPGEQRPAPASLIGLVLRRLAANWAIHLVYDRHYLYHVPSHLKSALMRDLCAYSDTGVSLGDLKALLVCPREQGDADNGGGVRAPAVIDTDLTGLDLTGALGKSLTLKDVTALLFPTRSIVPEAVDELQESWEAGQKAPFTALPGALLPNLTHLSLAVSPELAKELSWRDLLTLAPRLASVTHLSLAYWPEPCFLQDAQFATVISPQGHRIPYGGTNYYSHSIDHDWSEALLVLKKLSQSLYTLEFLDLTGCASWFKALMLRDEHAYVDWASNWGKISHLRLNIGWGLAEDAAPSARIAHREACDMAAAVERHIVASRGGRGRFITVERQSVQQ